MKIASAFFVGWAILLSLRYGMVNYFNFFNNKIHCIGFTFKSD